MRGKMERIGGQTPESWAKLGTVERAGLHLEKLEVEADVQRRIIAGLEQRAAAGEAAAADRGPRPPAPPPPPDRIAAPRTPSTRSATASTPSPTASTTSPGAPAPSAWRTSTCSGRRR